MYFETLSAWLTNTSASAYFRDAAWIVPTVQSIHILAICVVAGSALVLDLRLLRLIGRDEPVSTYTRRYLPWLAIAIVVLLMSGVIMIVAEPDRTLTNWVFWTKMAMVATGVFITVLLWAPTKRDHIYWDIAERRAGAAALGVISLAVWTAIILCGRWIAYVI
jgi:hypothetical protein